MDKVVMWAGTARQWIGILLGLLLLAILLLGVAQLIMDVPLRMAPRLSVEQLAYLAGVYWLAAR